MSIKELIDKYGVAENAELSGKTMPVINITMMSDEQWQQLSARQQICKKC